MKLFRIGVLTSFLLCWGCNEDIEERQAEILNQQVSGVSLSSGRSDSILISIDSLPEKYAVPLFLKMSEKDVSSNDDFLKKESCLLKAYDVSKGNNRKNVLFRMIAFYYEELCCLPDREEYALTEGYKRCKELGNGYSLSESEIIELYGRKADYLDRMKWRDKAFVALVRRDSLQNDYSRAEEADRLREITGYYKNRELISAVGWHNPQIHYSKSILIFSLVLIIALSGISVLFWRMYSRKKRRLFIIYQKQRELEKQKRTSPELKSPDEQFLIEIERVVLEKELFRDPDFSLDLLCKEIEVNRSYISSCIDTCSGKNFNQWANEFRIDYVLERISENAVLSELYKDAGFSSDDSFSRSFKQYTGITPKQYITYFREGK